MRGNAGQLIRNAEVIFSKGVALPRNWEEQLKPYNKPDETSKYRYVLYESQGCGGSFGIILKIDPRSHTVESPKIWGKTYSGRCSSK